MDNKIIFNGKYITNQEYNNLFNLGYINKTKKTSLENLELILCRPDGMELGILDEAYNVKITTILNDIDELEFDIPYYVEQQYKQMKNYNWDDLNDYLFIKVNNKQMFVVNQIIENGDKINSKHIHAFSKEYLLSKRKLANFQGTRQLYRGQEEGKVSKITYSLDGITWTTYSTPFIVDDEKNILIKIYDAFGNLLNEYTYNNKNIFFNAEGIDVVCNTKDVFNKKNEISIRIVSEIGDGILNLLEQETSWRIGFIDADVKEDRSLGQQHRKYRTFDIQNQSWLDILYELIKDLFNCVIEFDTINDKINIYHKDKYSKNKGLYITKDNYLKSIKKDLKNDEIITRLRIYGKKGLNISSINPLGTEYIEDFSYYRNSKHMSIDLLQSLDKYDKLVKDNTPIFYNYLQQLQTLRTEEVKLSNELIDLKMLKIQKEDSRDTAMQHATHHMNYSTSTGDGQSTDDNINVDFSDIHGLSLTSYNNEINLVQSQIDNKNNEIKNKNIQIEDKLNDIKNLQKLLDKKNNFTEKQLQTLDKFITEGSIENVNYDDAFELLREGERVLRNLSKPIIETSIDIIDFLNIVECQHDWDKMNIGDIINIYYDDFDLYFEAKIVKIEHDITTNQLQITISNNNEVDNDVKYLSDVMKNAVEANNTINTFKHEWDLSTKNTDYISQQINNDLNSAKNRITSARNQNIIIDERGIQMKDLFNNNEQLRIVNNCLCMTEDAWDSVSVAITPKFIVGQKIEGKIIGSNKLIITNMNESGESSFLVDGNNMKAINMDLSLMTKSLLNRLYLNPEIGFKIQNRETTTDEWKDLMWLSNNGEIYAKSFNVINNYSRLDDKGLVIYDGKFKIVNKNKYDAVYADENGEMRLDGRLRVIRHKTEWIPKDVWDLEPPENIVILLDAYKDNDKGGKLLINDWNGNRNAFLGSPPSDIYTGGFFKLYNGINENSHERLEMGVLKQYDTGIINIKNKNGKEVVSLFGNEKYGRVSIKNDLSTNIIDMYGIAQAGCIAINDENNNNIISLFGSANGGLIMINSKKEIGATNVLMGSFEEDEAFDGGFIRLFNKSIRNERTFIGIKKGTDAGTIELKNGIDGKNNTKILFSAIDDEKQSVGVLKLFNLNNEPSIFMSADTNRNPMSRENSSQLIFGEDVSKPRLGLYSGNNDYGSYVQLSDKSGYPQMFIGNVSKAETPGGCLVWYANMTDYTQTVNKRKVQIYVNQNKEGEILLYDSSDRDTPLGHILGSNGDLIIKHQSGASVRLTNDGKVYIN